MSHYSNSEGNVHYQGDFDVDEEGRNVRNGRGKMIYTDGKEYDGEWRNNLRHGSGVLKFPNNDVYEGQFQNDLMEGSGRFTWENGDSYGGQFVKGLRHGQGTMSWSNDDHFEGNFMSGKMEGFGSFIEASGGRYEGEFYDGKRQGQGTYSSSFGTYSGSFANGLKEGRGSEKYFDGDMFEGEWLAGFKHGSGRMTYKNGGVYVGEFKSGLRHGKGMEKSKDHVYDGMWTCGLPFTSSAIQSTEQFNSLAFAACTTDDVEVLRELSTRFCATTCAFLCTFNVQQPETGNTSLFITSSVGHVEAVHFLLGCSAGVDIQNRDGSSALHISAQCGYAECVSLLLAAGAKYNLKDAQGDTAAHKAAASSLTCSTSVLHLLATAGANLNIQNNMGQTPLHIVLMSGGRNKQMIEESTALLLSYGVRTDTMDKKGMNALQYASSAGIILDVPNIVEYLRRCGDIAISMYQAIQKEQYISHSGKESSSSSAATMTRNQPLISLEILHAPLRNCHTIIGPVDNTVVFGWKLTFVAMSDNVKSLPIEWAVVMTRHEEVTQSSDVHIYILGADGFLQHSRQQLTPMNPDIVFTLDTNALDFMYSQAQLYSHSICVDIVSGDNLIIALNGLTNRHFHFSECMQTVENLIRQCDNYQAFHLQNVWTEMVYGEQVCPYRLVVRLQQNVNQFALDIPTNINDFNFQVAVSLSNVKRVSIMIYFGHRNILMYNEAQFNTMSYACWIEDRRLLEQIAAVDGGGLAADYVNTQIEEQAGNKSKTCIIVCAERNNAPALDIVLQIPGANQKLKDHISRIALHYAAMGGHLEIVRRLCDCGSMIVDQNVLNDTNSSKLIYNWFWHTLAGATALFMAADCGHLEVVRMLVDTYHADENIRSGLFGRPVDRVRNKQGGNWSAIYAFLNRANVPPPPPPQPVPHPQDLPPVKCITRDCQFYGNAGLGSGEFCSQHYYEVNRIPRPVDRFPPIVPSICYFLNCGGFFNAECIPASALHLNPDFRNGPQPSEWGDYPCQPCWDRWQRVHPECGNDCGVVCAGFI